MDRSEVPEFHYITPVDNLPSIARYGLLSHNLVARLPHRSVALAQVQDRRAGKQVPGGLQLHDYANLYFDARNPMMSLLKYKGCNTIVVLRVSASIMDIKGAVISDGNAACGTTRFFPSPAGLSELNKSLVYAEWWTDPNPFRKAELKRIRCAEILIPERVPVEFITGVLAETNGHLKACRVAGFAGEVKRHVFFR
ncbi:DUF4433 domain-containing protein [Micromonospora matsumotoense]|uniref:DUF4433 domain-containing protein n=1 Tax=Micromonospora matsumotoense TaxID=121616 RepID=UPI0033F9CDDA